jgi:PAS domain S-box-containing protein
MSDVDYRLLFASAPGMRVLLDVDEGFTVLDASDSYLRAVGRERAALVGRPIEEVAADATLRPSLERVRASGTRESLELRRDGRMWTVVHAPVLAGGAVRYILHRIEDDVLAMLHDAIPDPVLLVAGDGRVVSVNRAGAGRTVDARLLQAVVAAVRDGRRVSYEHRTGARVEQVSVTPAHGTPHAVVMIRDITAASAALEGQAELRQIVDLMPVHISARDRDGRFLFCNRQAAETMSADPDAVVGRTVADLLPDMAGAIVARDREAIETGGLLLDPERELRIDGEPRTFYSLRVAYTSHVTGEPAVLSASLDITDLRRTQEALRLAEARYRTQFEHAPEAILTLDVDAGHFVEANGKAAELFGHSREALLGLGPLALSAPIQPDGRGAEEALRGQIGRVLAGERAVFEWLCRDARGRDLPIEARLVQLPAAGQNLVRGSLIDISDRRRAEAQRARSAELELEYRRIQEANRLKSEFLANMSHELRTPLNAIIGFTELLADGQVAPDSPEHAEFLGDILGSARHLLQLINDVLDLAKVEAGKLELQPEEVDLGAVVGEVVSILRGVSASKRITVATEVDAAGSAVVDPARLKQILYNFLSNALKFTPEGGRVTVRVRAEAGDAFRLEVEDTGVGIPTAHLGRLFVEFQQLDSGMAKRQPGTGLGLALTRRLVESHGGVVGVRSTVGAGSVFNAVLPRRAVVTAPLQSLSRPGAPNILVVEDDDQDRAVIARALAAAGYGVVTAATGAQALARLGERRFDAVTLDVILPDMNGLDLLARIRGGEDHAAVPVILATVVGDAHLVAGVAVQDVLHKPFEADALLAALRRAGIGPSGGDILVVEDDAATVKLLEAALRRGGYRTTARGDGASALAAADASPPRAVILDLVMPGLDGFAFLEHFRGDERHRTTPVIVWTQKELSDAERERLQASAQAVLAKSSLSASRLVEVLDAHLQPRGGG